MAPPPSARNALSTGLLRAAINSLEGNRKIGSNASNESRVPRHEEKLVQTRRRHERQLRSSRAGSSSGGRRGNHRRRSRDRSNRGRRRDKRSCRRESCAKACEDSEEIRHSRVKDKRAKMENMASGAKSAERASPESDMSQLSPHRTVNSSRLADEHADMLVMQRRQHLEEARRRLEAEYERIKANETKKSRRETAERRNMEELSELHRKRQAEREATERLAARRRRELAKADAGIPAVVPVVESEAPPSEDKADAGIPAVVAGVESEAPPREDSEDAGGSVASESVSKRSQQLHNTVQPNKHPDEIVNRSVPATEVAVTVSELLVPCKSQQQSEADPSEACKTRIASPIDANDVAISQQTCVATPPVAPQTNVADVLEARSEVAAQESDCAADESGDSDVAEQAHEEAPDQRAARLSRHRCSLMSCTQEDEEDPI